MIIVTDGGKDEEGNKIVWCSVPIIISDREQSMNSDQEQMMTLMKTRLQVAFSYGLNNFDENALELFIGKTNDIKNPQVKTD